MESAERGVFGHGIGLDFRLNAMHGNTLTCGPELARSSLLLPAWW